MEKLKKPHDHTLTNILKVCIFAIFLLLPLMLFMPNVLYYGFNEHATDPEVTNVEIEYKYQSNEANTINDIQKNNLYYDEQLILGATDQDNVDLDIYIVSMTETNFSSYQYDDVGISNYTNQNGNYINLYFDGEYSYLYFTNSNAFVCMINDPTNETLYFNDVIYFVKNDDSLTRIKNYYLDNDKLPQYTDYNIIKNVNVQTTNSLSSKMQLAWQETWQQPIFNWTNNNNFIFTINAFTNVFGITQQSYITNYLTYILTLTAIYIVFDIIINVFTKLTHMLQ